MRNSSCLDRPHFCDGSSRRISRSFKTSLAVLQTVLALLTAASLAQPLMAQTAVDSPTWRYDTTHAGTNTRETLLTPANVTGATFGKLFSRAVDGYVYAQPLYISGLTMGDGLVHNVLFVATEHDSIYAFDADSNGGANAKPLWQVSLLDTAHGAATGATTVPSSDLGSSDIVPEVGITGTPAIDTATKTLFVVGKTKENGVYIQRLHAINILTGAEMAHSPTPIQATVPGTGLGSSGGDLPFSPLWELNRGALNFYNGYVYIAFGAHGDNGPWHGWVYGFNSTTLAQSGVICLSPSGYGNGVWQSGAGLPIDDGGTAGRMFVALGNGTYSAYPPYAGANYGDSIITLDLAKGALVPTDAFTPFNQAKLSASDVDQGAGGILLLPDQQGANPHILIQLGKEGRILVLDRDKLGGYAPNGSSNTNALQDILGQTKGLWSTPAYWNGNVYMWGTADHGKMFDLNSGVLNTTYANETTLVSAFPGPSFTISANGTQDGIAWAADTEGYKSNGSAILYAFDATNLSKALYASDTNASRDDAGPATKFAIPVVTNGKVYLGASYQVDVYGLLTGDPTAVAPVITPDGGVFNAAQTVKLTTTTPSASIYYTLDGSVPSTAATLYTGAFTLKTETVVRAIASATDYIQSPVTSATFTFATQTPMPVLTPAPGTYATAQKVALTDTNTAAVIYYTLDGSTPSASSTKYTAPITVSAASTTLNAIAIAPTLQASDVAGGVYQIQSGATTINFGSGFASTVGLTLNGSTIASDDSRMQLTDSGTFEAGSVFWNKPISIQAFTTDFSFQLSSAVADGFTFAIQNVGVTALGAYGQALGYSPIKNSVAIKFDFFNNAGEGTDSTGVYTDGAVPTIPFVDMTSSGLLLNSGHALQAHVTYDGATLTMKLTDVVTNKTFTLTRVIDIPSTVGANTAYVGFTGGTGGSSASQKILTWTYAVQTPTALPAAPVFSPAGGSYTTTQKVALSSTTAGAVIHYTTNGTTPTASSAVYAAPLAVGYGTTKLEALAIANGALSPVTSATYVITEPVTPAPVFTPAAGTYVGVQSISIADSDRTAVIHYTVNGTAPSAASATYATPLAISSSTTIKAIAIDPARDNSTVTTAAYVITAGSPIAINYANGFTANGMTLNGSAGVTAGLLQLTNSTYQAGSAFYSTPVNVQAFTTTFTFQLLKAQADGFTFTIQNAGPTAIGHIGGSLGYGNGGSTGGIGESAAVKFDFYSNGGEGSDSTGLYTDATNPTAPAIDMTSSGVVLNSGDTMQAQFTYDGQTLKLSLLDTVTKKTFTQSFPIDLPQVVGANTAYVGFTGGTGGRGATQNIHTWTYEATETVPPTIDFTNGFSGASSLSLKGTAALNAASLQLTEKAAYTKAAAAWYSKPVSIAAFTTDFNFQLVNALGDGMTFTIQNQGVDAIGSIGEGLGYGSDTTAGIQKSIAVKFDIFNNKGEGADSTGFYKDGASPTIPATDMTASGVNPASGDVMHAHLTYDGTTMVLLLTDTKTSASFTTTYAVNIPTVVGASTAYVGFTAGIGGSSMTSDILNWTFTATK